MCRSSVVLSMVLSTVRLHIHRAVAQANSAKRGMRQCIALLSTVRPILGAWASVAALFRLRVELYYAASSLAVEHAFISVNFNILHFVCRTTLG